MGLLELPFLQDLGSHCKEREESREKRVEKKKKKQVDSRFWIFKLWKKLVVPIFSLLSIIFSSLLSASFGQIKYLKILNLFLLFIPLLLYKCESYPKINKDAQNGGFTPSRIISFAPSITETIFAVGAGEKLIGVTDFCNYPPEVKKISKLGGYKDPNYEAILRLKPDYAILLKEHTSVIDFLKSNNIPYLFIINHTVKDILQTITEIGRVTGKPENAKVIRDSIEKELSVPKDYGLKFNKKRPKILLCIGRQDVGCGTISKIWVAGPTTFYNELITVAGGDNIIADSLLEYSVLCTESIIRLKPDIIIDVMANMYEVSSKTVIEDWKKFDMIPAIQNNRVFALSDEYVNIPGPRILLLLKDFKRIVREYKKEKRVEMGEELRIRN